jgi:hypothetical protein
MKTFGIRMGEPGGSPNHYIAADNVSDDSVLFDWLTADNFEQTEEFGTLNVLAPEGYIFEEEMLVPVSECTEEEVLSAADEDSDFWVNAGVSTAYCDADKVRLLLEGVMKSVSRAEFYALKIPKRRVLDFIID